MEAPALHGADSDEPEFWGSTVVTVLARVKTIRPKEGRSKPGKAGSRGRIAYWQFRCLPMDPSPVQKARQQKRWDTVAGNFGSVKNFGKRTGTACKQHLELLLKR